MKSLEPIASTRHFRTFAIISLIVTLLGVTAQLHAAKGASQNPGHGAIVLTYLVTIIAEWLLLFFVWRGVRAYGGNLFSLAGRWKTPLAAATDLILGALVALGLLLLGTFVQRFFPADQALVDQLLPKGPLESVLWIALSLTGGIVEEMVFRGFLLRQLSARLRNVSFAVVAQALWFGAMHAYQGVNNVVTICLIGVALGLVAIWRNQLRTNIIAHSCVDLLGGFAPHFLTG